MCVCVFVFVDHLPFCKIQVVELFWISGKVFLCWPSTLLLCVCCGDGDMGIFVLLFLGFWIRCSLFVCLFLFVGGGAVGGRVGRWLGR